MDTLNPEKSTHRIELIDSFRGLAILSVILFHYYSRYAPPTYLSNLYPYEPVNFFLIDHGYYGVMLFFIISGFVISQSLENSPSSVEFLKNRFIRLFPTMLLCTLITYFFLFFVSMEDAFREFHSSTLLDFLPSLTFTSPEFWNAMLLRNDIKYIDGAYWSLWTEVFFYISAGLIYFLRAKNFLTVWLVLTTCCQAIRIATSPKMGWLYPEAWDTSLENIYHMFFLFNLNYWIYFALGIAAFTLYSKRKVSWLQKVMISVLILLELYFLNILILRILFIALLILFVLFLYYPTILRFLKINVLLVVGLVSYPLYLLHQSIGVMLIAKLGKLGLSPTLHLFIPLLVMSLFIILSYLIFRYYEKPVIRYLRSK